MRIALANWSRRRAGGVESYLSDVAPPLLQHGHDLALITEVDQPADREIIAASGVSLDITCEAKGMAGALAALREWRPDVVYIHQLHNLALERELMELAPTIAFAHAYYGTCISGSKTHRLPSVHPCSRTLGPGCLAHFYPNRCGGLNPFTTLHLYKEQTARLELMRRHTAVVTFSAHMAREYENHGIQVTKLWTTTDDVIPESVSLSAAKDPSRAVGIESNEGVLRFAHDDAFSREQSSTPRVAPGEGEPWRFMFLGRFDYLKGPQVLLEALALVASEHNTSMIVRLVGDGRGRETIERRAGEITSRYPHVSVELAGWLTGEALEREWKLAHALVMPSIWPEPFGLVGIEAGRRGLPVIGFDVGAIPEWLDHRVNGLLVDLLGDSARHMATGIMHLVSDAEAYSRMSRAAERLSRRWSMENHLAALNEVLELAARQPRVSS